MKTNHLIFALLSAWFMASCTLEPVEPNPCEATYDQAYKDYKNIAFTIQDSDTMYLNYGAQTYDERPDDYVIEVFSPHGYQSLIEFNFTRIILEGDECTARKQHQLIVTVDVDQKPYEIKDYSIGSVYSQINGRNHALYTGEALDPSEYLRVSVGEDNGIFTVTKYIPDRFISGHFDINVDGIAATGEFEIDLTADY